MATVSNPLYGLEHLFTALYSGDPEGRRASRESLIAKRNKDAELTDLRIQGQKQKQDAVRQAATTQANLPDELARAVIPDAPNGFVKSGGVVQPQAETSDMPGVIGGYRDDRYTPDLEKRIAERVFQTRSAAALPGKSNIQQVAHAEGAGQQQGIIQSALDGLRSPSDTGAIFAAIKGTAPFKEGASGGTTNVYSGKQDQTAPIPVAKVEEFNARAGKEGAQAGQARALAGKITSETLPQITVPAPAGITTPIGTVQVRGADVSRAATRPAAPAADAKGWKMFTDTDGTNYRVNENAGGIVQKKSGAGWQDIDSLPAGTTHIGSNLGVKDNVRTSLVLGGAQNALDRLKEAEKQFGSTAVLRGSPYLGKHPKGVVSEVMHGIGREMIPDEQLNKDSYITGIVDEAIPVFTGGLRSSDSFRDFLLSQLPRAVGDNDVTTKQKWDIFKKNITGQSNAFRNKFNSTPSFRATGETSQGAPPAASGVPAAGAGPTVTNW